MTVHQALQLIWKDRNPIAWLLWPLSLVYCCVVELRRFLYSIGLFAITRFDQPFIVIGNLTVGGTGKTPLTVWLVNFLKENGYSPAVVSRGYGRINTDVTMLVSPASDPIEVGDEPVLISRRTQSPVAVSKYRIDAVRLLNQHTNCDIVVSDDGLQHLSIEPSLTIALIDGEERFGNSFCLPAGPLREGTSRLKSVDFKLVRGIGTEGEYSMNYRIDRVVNVCDPRRSRSIESLVDEQVVAVAGIRNSHRFFDLLEECGVRSRNIPFPDHHRFTIEDFHTLNDSETTVVMTEKDAVKCEYFAGANWWYVAIDANPEPQFVTALKDSLSRLTTHRKSQAGGNSKV